jgi:hypothetical protein
MLMMTDDELSNFRATVRGIPVENDREKLLEAQLKKLVENVADIRNGRGSRKRSLFVIGKSSSGKSFALEKLFSQIPEMQPYINQHGQNVRPLLSIEAEEGGIPQLCNRVCRALGLPEQEKMTPDFAWTLIKTMLREHGVIYLHIDEAQDLLKHKTAYALSQMQVKLKSLIQTSEWPLHAIFSGVDELALLLATVDDQLGNRAYKRRFDDLVLPDDLPIIKSILKSVTEDSCKLKLAKKLLTDDFLSRLWVAGNRGAFGKIIETVQEACFLAVKNEHAELQVDHFEYEYERHTGCLDKDNVFTAPKWSDIVPQRALSDLTSDLTKKRAKA